MNIFEDLVDELKKENLLEETVVETSRTLGHAEMYDEEIIEAQTFLENYAQEQSYSPGQIAPESGNEFDSSYERAIGSRNFSFEQFTN